MHILFVRACWRSLEPAHEKPLYKQAAEISSILSYVSDFHV